MLDWVFSVLVSEFLAGLRSILIDAIRGLFG